MKRLLFSLTTISLLLTAQSLHASAEADWQAIEHENRATISENLSQQEAVAATLRLLDKQESDINNFLAKYPADSHRIPATLQLAHLLAERTMLTGNAEFYDSAQRILEGLLAESQLDESQKADIAYAQIALTMRHIRPNDNAAISELFDRIAQFRKAHDGDPRIPSLLVNASPLLDAQPAREKTLLLDAKSLTANDALLREIADDLHRIALLGQPLALHFTATNGHEIDTADLRGKIVVIVFFAEWSPLSLFEMQKLKNFLAAAPQHPDVRVLGISLDQSRDALTTILDTMQIDWPISFDGKGFRSPLVRKLGINSLPTIWILDREGRLVALNSWTNCETAILSAESR